MSSQHLVVGEEVAKTYGSASAAVHALQGANVSIGRGEFVVISGPSGSGKTTLLHCLAGLTTPDAGRVSFDGVDLATLDDDGRTDLRAKKMGFVFQFLNLIPALTTAENVELPLVLQGADVETIRGNRTRRLEQVGLGDRVDAYPAQLSGGEQQRVALARALVGDPDIVWADEPTGSLDQATAAEMVDLLREATSGGAAVVVVTHDPRVAAAADRTIEIVDGKIL